MAQMWLCKISTRWGGIAPCWASANLPSKVSRDMGYRSDSIAVSRDMGPPSYIPYIPMYAHAYLSLQNIHIYIYTYIHIYTHISKHYVASQNITYIHYIQELMLAQAPKSGKSTLKSNQHKVSKICFFTFCFLHFDMFWSILF